MIQWRTLITDKDGIIEYERVRALAAVCLASLAGVATVWVVFLVNRNVNEALVGIMVGACVAPLTGGRIADAVQNSKNKRETAEVVAGNTPGRRASDAGVAVVP